MTIRIIIAERHHRPRQIINRIDQNIPRHGPLA
jgi:hypothetical protein